MTAFLKIDKEKIVDWEWWSNPNAVALWMHLLVKANWRDKKFLGIVIHRGELVASVRSLADETGLAESTVKRWLKQFQKDSQIEVRGYNKFTLIKLLNYAKYQESAEGTEPSDERTHELASEPTGEPPSELPTEPSTELPSEPQPKQESRKAGKRYMDKPTVGMISEYIAQMKYNVDAEKFWDYYESNGWKVGKNPMKDWRACVRTWNKNQFKGNGWSKKEDILPAYMTDVQGKHEEVQTSAKDIERLLSELGGSNGHRYSNNRG